VLGAGLPDAPDMAAESVDLARSLADHRLLAESLIVTGMPKSRHLRSASDAIATAREGRDLAAPAGDAWLVAAADAVEGGARALSVDGLAEAVSLLERAGRGYAELGDERSAEVNAWYLSQAYEDSGDTASAETVLAPFVAKGHVLDSAGAILDTARAAWLARRSGDCARAASFADRLTAIATVQQRRLFWGAAQFAIGHAALDAGDLHRARNALTAALDMHTQIGMERFVILEHALLGHVAQGEGREADSVGLHDAAIRRADAYALPLPRILALELAAQSAQRRQRPAEAIELQTRAAVLRAAHGLAPTPHERERGEKILLLSSAS
jgi:hypothetical protein